MPPIAAFVVGVLCSELVQAAVWGMAHPGRKVRGYLDDGVWHFVLAWGVCGFVAMLWALNGLDAIVAWLPDAMTASWADTGVPYTPQVGAVLGFAVDAMADKIAFAFRARFAPAPAIQGGTD